MKTFSSVWVLCGMISIGVPAFSQDTKKDVTPSKTEDPTSAAGRAYEDGKTAFAEQRFVESASYFRKAYELKPAWKILYNIGQAEASAKRYGFALAAFERYLADGGDEIDSLRQDEVLKEIARLRNLVGYIHIQAPAGAIISVDDVTLGQAPIRREVPIAATEQHVVKAMQSNTLLSEQTVEVNGGRTVNVDLTPASPKSGISDAGSRTDPGGSAPLETSPQTESAPDSPSKSKMSKLRLAGIVTAASGGALLIGGAVTGGLALLNNAKLEDDCSNRVCPSGTDMSAQKRRDALGLATDILIPVGAVAAAAGIALIVVDLVRSKRERAASTLWIFPVLAPNGAGLAFEGRF